MGRVVDPQFLYDSSVATKSGSRRWVLAAIIQAMHLTSAPRYALHVKWALAIFLVLIAGYLDGYGLLVRGAYVSFMSGNTNDYGPKEWTGQFPRRLAFRNSHPILRHW